MVRHQARKRFGQNFLRDETVIQHIVQAIKPAPEQCLIEIGPGRGALTAALLAATRGHLIAIELDRDLIPLLRTRFFNQPEFSLREGDALKIDYSDFAEANKPLRIVGNLPYNISTPLIFHLLEYANVIFDMHFMLQREVVDRLAANPNSKAYGRLGVMVQYQCQVDALFDVPPAAFSPQPKVTSSVVRLTPHAKLPVNVQNEQHLQQIVKTAFALRRKTIANNLKSLLSAEEIRAVEIDPNCRAEQLSLRHFGLLSDMLSAKSE